MKKLLFTVTNDLTYDQRMQRICTSLAANGYDVTLVGRQLPQSHPLASAPYRQVRLRCFFSTGFLFYAEYNIRLLFLLLRSRLDAVCAIDLDTILPCLFVSVLRRIPRFYDAHELFTEMKEVRSRPLVYRFWRSIERFAVPRFTAGYTVGNCLAAEFRKRYGVKYAVVRNIPMLRSAPVARSGGRYLLYQGAVNEARGLEYLVPAMKVLPYQLVVCGDGNFMPQLKELILRHEVSHKITLTGMVTPAALAGYSAAAILGFNLVEKEGLNQYLSLANKFFDYIHAGLPQLTMNYPEYRSINDIFDVALLIDEPATASIVAAVENFMKDEEMQQRLRSNCIAARAQLNWQAEEQQLLSFYRKHLG